MLQVWIHAVSLQVCDLKKKKFVSLRSIFGVHR